MNNTDLVTIIGNLSRSLFDVQRLLSGFAYVLGIAFFVIALVKFKKASGRNSSEKMMTPLAFLLGGLVFVYLPSAVTIVANSTFGVGNILQYANYNPYDIYSAMGILIQTAGLIWFIRGCVLLIYSSQPGAQHGPKGLAFLCAGILAMNFHTTTAALASIMNYLERLTLNIKG